MQKNLLNSHLLMFCACAFWGLMAPLGKDAMLHGVDGISMVTFRVVGAAVLFWTTSFFTKHEEVPWRDRLMLIGAAFCGIVCNQCCYTIGLSLTSPVNASVVTTSMPIFAMIMAFLLLGEPITWKKVVGIACGCSGALILILTSASVANDKVGDIRGDLLCLLAQFSYATYLSLFQKLIRRYSVVTINKWMFLWAALMLLPFTSHHVASLPWAEIAMKTWLEVAYVVCFATYASYIFSMYAQQHLRPTVISVYNYVQPTVSVSVSLLAGIAILHPAQLLAIVLVFSGVALVTRSRAKAQ